MWNVHECRGTELVLGSLTQGDHDASDGHDSSEDDPGGAQRVVVYRGQKGSRLYLRTLSAVLIIPHFAAKCWDRGLKSHHN